MLGCDRRSESILGGAGLARPLFDLKILAAVSEPGRFSFLQVRDSGFILSQSPIAMSPPTAKTFTVMLEADRARPGWVFARIPFDVAEVWPERRGLRVRGEISSLKSDVERFAFRASLFPNPAGDGKTVPVNRKMQAAVRGRAGDKVKIRLEPDLEEREAVVSPELAKALEGDRRLRRWFDGLNDYFRRAIGAWVSEAKSAASREQRAERMAERLLLTLEGETDVPPILKAAFLRQPLAQKGWNAMTAARRRNHLLGIFYYQTADGRERRAGKAVEDALRVARKAKTDAL